MTTLRKDFPAAPSLAEYGTEVLCAGWNPVASLVVSGVDAQACPSPGNIADAESFLAQFYRLQQA
ncbi:MAG: hypothetical protein OEW79_06065 [Betaproteobacteria bacterium]|jgi:hypothetical protein|nr:hypothetical protein [Betaproteobacteria bacterium]MDH5342383.1 hypothetical protein [Betaproteobacteria bacterium]